MALTPGSRIGSYEISAQIGAGGMGEVYRATDTKLGREVAIKVLPEAFARDAERLARFDREAKLLAQLNHPNIGGIHGLEQSDGTTALVLELVEGETLADRLVRGAMPVEEALGLALQIAAALEGAHEKGVVHRDLKPANVKITPEGQIKVLDFGLAKTFEGQQANPALTNSPTLSLAATQAGVVLGTAAYMSPEQARGGASDRRADIWSFGVVLFEMLTGRQVFAGETVSDVMAAVLAKDPPWGSLPADLHPRLRELLERCLEKKAADRYRDIGDVRVDLQKVLADPAGPTARPDAAAGAGSSRTVPWVAAVVLVAIVAGAGGWFLRPAESPPVSRWEYLLPDGRTFRNTGRQVVALSPDGTQLVYNASGGLYLRSIDELEAKLIPGTEEQVTNLTFSPDGDSLAYWSVADGQLKRIASFGGAAVPLADVPSNPNGIDWSEDGTLAYSAVEGIMRVSPEGSEPELLLPGNNDQWLPQLLPGGHAVLFTTAANQIAVQSLDASEPRLLFPGLGARYVSTGHLVYVQDGVLFAVPFDPGQLETTGGPVPLVEDVLTTIVPQFSVAASGSLAYVAGSGPFGASGIGVPAFVDRDGEVERFDLPPNEYRSPRLSPDGSRLVVEIVDDGGQSAIWVYDVTGTTQIQRLTRAQDGSSVHPIWTPDGESVTFASDRSGAWGIYRQRADGSAVAERLTTAEQGSMRWPESWSPDGRFLSFANTTLPSSSASMEIWMLSMDTGEAEVFYDLPDSNQEGSAFSPDGRWIAYSSFEEGSAGVYVEPFPRVDDEIQYVVARNGEIYPSWTRDGRELFYRVSTVSGRPASINGVEVRTEPSFAVSNERTMPVENYLFFSSYQNYDVTPDGDRFLVLLPAGSESVEASAPTITVVLNWFEELRRRVPVD